MARRLRIMFVSFYHFVQFKYIITIVTITTHFFLQVFIWYTLHELNVYTMVTIFHQRNQIKVLFSRLSSKHLHLTKDKSYFKKMSFLTMRLCNQINTKASLITGFLVFLKKAQYLDVFKSPVTYLGWGLWDCWLHEIFPITSHEMFEINVNMLYVFS